MNALIRKLENNIPTLQLSFPSYKCMIQYFFTLKLFHEFLSYICHPNFGGHTSCFLTACLKICLKPFIVQVSKVSGVWSWRTYCISARPSTSLNFLFIYIKWCLVESYRFHLVSYHFNFFLYSSGGYIEDVNGARVIVQDNGNVEIFVPERTITGTSSAGEVLLICDLHFSVLL